MLGLEAASVCSQYVPRAVASRKSPVKRSLALMKELAKRSEKIF